jgi:hypothetical protein
MVIRCKSQIINTYDQPRAIVLDTGRILYSRALSLPLWSLPKYLGASLREDRTELVFSIPSKLEQWSNRFRQWTWKIEGHSELITKARNISTRSYRELPKAFFLNPSADTPRLPSVS